jgi:hypothetical protein
MMDVWTSSSFVFLACVGFVDPSGIFGVLACLFLFASSFPGIKLILDHVNFVTISTSSTSFCIIVFNNDLMQKLKSILALLEQQIGVPF